MSDTNIVSQLRLENRELNRRIALQEETSLEKENAGKALEDSEKRYRRLFESAKDGILILDVVMPRKGGKEAYEEMRKARADLKVIFMSGYTANAVHESFILIAGNPFLSKPFGPGVFARKVREVLDKT